MKCGKCGGTAVLNMRQHRRSLCAKHLVEWFLTFTQRTIDKYDMFTAEDRVLLAVSGGKDSLALWDVLLKLGYQAEGMYIGLGIDEDQGYSDKSLEMCHRFVSDHHPEAVLHVVDVEEEYGQTIPYLARTRRRGQGKPCSVCGLVKRHIMNEVALHGSGEVLRGASGSAGAADLRPLPPDTTSTTKWLCCCRTPCIGIPATWLARHPSWPSGAGWPAR